MSTLFNFIYYIWNHHGKCIQISTNMPGIGPLIREIKVKFKQLEECKKTFDE